MPDACHRSLADVRHADRVSVLHHGHPLMEAGNHGELIMTDGSYAELYSLQAAGNYRPADEVD